MLASFDTVPAAGAAPPEVPADPAVEPVEAGLALERVRDATAENAVAEREDAIALFDQDPFAKRGLVAARLVREWIPVFGPESCNRSIGDPPIA